MTQSIYDLLYPEYTTVLKTAHDWLEYIKRYKVRNNCPHLPVAIAVPTKDFLDLVNNFKQVSHSNRSRRKHTISVLAKAHLTERTSRLVPPGHFLKWVIVHRPQTYNELLREYHDFCANATSPCSDPSEKSAQPSCSRTTEKLDFEDLIPKQPPLITNAAWLLPEDFKKKYWKTYPTKRK